MSRRIAQSCALVAALALAAGCASGGADQPEQGGQAAPVVAEGALVAPAPGQPVAAVTYDPEDAPLGATLRVETVRAPDSTTATLTVGGLVPNRGYAAHLHTDPCGPEGDAAGPHFQHELDPAANPDSPSVDPAFANPQNEMWLDVRTDAAGNGTTTATVPWPIDDQRPPQSLIVHEEEVTATAPGEAGTAGDRVACLTVSP